MVEWECPTNPREASGLDPEAVHRHQYDLTPGWDGSAVNTAGIALDIHIVVDSTEIS